MRKILYAILLLALLGAGSAVGILAAGGTVFSFTFTDANRTVTVPARTYTSAAKVKTFTAPAQTYTFAGQTHSVTTTVADTTTAPPPPPGEPTPIAGQGYAKVFGDEFDGTTLDAASWNPKEFWEDEPLPGAVVVSNGTVKINNTRRDTSNGYPGQSISTGPYWGLEQSKKSWMFGYFEARMKFTDAKGSWPAFWLLSREQAEWPGWPSCTNRDLNFELDIMEYQGDERTQFYGTQHRNTNDVCGTPDQTRSVFTNPGVLAGAFHTFSAKWTATDVTWYVDDVQQGAPQPLFDSGDQQMVMSLTMQACGWDNTNACDSSTPPALVTEVDWVHVWQK